MYFGCTVAVWKPGSGWAQSLLGGSWVVISGVISPLSRVISIVTLLLTLINYNYP